MYSYSLLSRLLAAATLFVLLCGCDSTTTQTTPERRELSLQEQQIASAANDFGFELFRAQIAASGEENVFISPLSVSFALGMTYNGAASTTEVAMRQTLGFDTLTLQEINAAYSGLMGLLINLDPKVTMEIADSIWYQEGFEVLPDFIERNETYFDAEIRALDFAAADAASTINAWVNDKTHGKIKDIVEDPIAPELVMFLINAVYFKGTWTIQFDPAQTQDGPFTTSFGAQVQVPMMSLHDDLYCLSTPDLQAVDLAYGDGLFRMAVLLPKPGTDIDDLAAQIDSSTWSGWMSQMQKQEAEIFLPRFELEYNTSLVDVLTSLGMGVAFSGEADFSGINPTADLYISDVKHKTYLKVDEEGTEAAAVTSVEIGNTSVPSYFTMVVNRPFLLVIHDTHSQTMLFMGKIGNPS